MDKVNSWRSHMQDGNEQAQTIGIIQKHLEFLFLDGFEIVEYVPPAGFGNWMVYLESDKFNIVIKKDMVEVFPFLVPAWIPNWKTSKKNWISSDFLLGYLLGDITYRHYKGNVHGSDNQIEKIAKDLKDHYQTLVSLFQKDNYTAAIQDIETYCNQRRQKELGLKPK